MIVNEFVEVAEEWVDRVDRIRGVLRATSISSDTIIIGLVKQAQQTVC